MNRFLTTHQVSALTGYSVKTLANLRSQRRGPQAFKNGGSVRYKETEVKEWMEKNFNPIPMVNDRKIPVGSPRSERR